MAVWETVKLSELGEIVGGATPSTSNPLYYGGDIPWITPKDLSKHVGRYISFGERNITEDGLNSCSAKLLPKHSVLFTSRAPIGYVAISDAEMATNQGFKSIIPNSNVDYLFLYYLLVYNKSKIEALGSGTTFKEVSGAVMKGVEVSIPDISTQKKIASILSSLDDKIELNTRMNKVLEEQAQALFKHWFVDFEFPNEEGKPYRSSGGKMVESEMGMIPEEWKVGSLEEIANIVMGQSPSGSSYNESGVGMVFYQGRAEFGMRYPTRRLFTTEPKRIAEMGDVLLSVRAPVGDVNIASEKCCIGRGLASLSEKEKCQSYLFYLIQNLKSSFDIYNGDGTVFGSINTGSLKSLQIIHPSLDIKLKYNNIIMKIDEIISRNSVEMDKLSLIRDTLLPKLMDGSVEINL